MASSPYFDGCYFDPLYFDASVCAPTATLGRHVRSARRGSVFIDDALPVPEDQTPFILLLLEDD